jgi:hypothetical protein
MKKLTLSLLTLSSTLAFAAPPTLAPVAPGRPPANFQGGPGEGGPGEHFQEMQQRMHMMAVVSISEALGLDEGGALKVSNQLKLFEEKRRPVREQMHEAMKTIKAAADGDEKAGANVDAAVQKVLDGRTQMAALDKDLYTMLSTGLTPQKKAKLAMVMGRLHREAKEHMGGGMGGGRRFRGERN